MGYFADATIVDFTGNMTDRQLYDLLASIEDVCGRCPVSQPNGDAYCEECAVRILWSQAQASIDKE